ncbi:MAG: RNase adapter RapZ, partial [Pseudomonadota bacterium]
MSDPETKARRAVLITGPAGAGRTSAIRVLEDLGYEAIDNLPLRLVHTLLDDPEADRPLALGIDPRTRDFSVTAVTDALGQMAAVPGLVPELLYMDCRTDVLLNRFSETRRRHPLATGDRVEAGIQRELDMLTPLRAQADVLIDTSNLNVHQLRAEVEHWFSPDDHATLSVSVQSFSYKRGLPRAVDMVFDCRFLKNPYWDPDLRHLNGTDQGVRDHIASDPRASDFEAHVRDLILWLLPA